MSPWPFGLLTTRICHMPSLHLQTLKNIPTSHQWNLLIFRFSSELHQPAFEMKAKTRWKTSHDSSSIKQSAMTKCHLPSACAVCCHLEEKPLAPKGWSHVFFLLRNCDLTLCVIHDLHYCCDWMPCTGCPWFPLRRWGLEDVPIPGVFRLQLRSDIVRNDLVTDDPFMEQGHPEGHQFDPHTWHH